MLQEGINIHPLLIEELGEGEAQLMAFKDQLSQFKPKASVLEQNIMKSPDLVKIEKFKDTMHQHAKRQFEKKE